jgi:5-methylcytosine-specific restriction endonuclease McrA
LPHNPARYNPDWPAVSQRIRERDGHKCARCGVVDRSAGYWDGNAFVTITPPERDILVAAAEDEGRKVITVILTVAHLDQDSRNDADSNLLLLCARCHRAHDREPNLLKASVTRWTKQGRGTIAMPFFEQPIVTHGLIHCVQDDFPDGALFDIPATAGAGHGGS